MATKPKTTTSAGTTMSPMDMVQNPNFDMAMAQQNYANNLQQSLANYQAQNPTQGAGNFATLSPNQAQSSGQNNNFQKIVKDAGKQIILSFEGETYGTANDKSANEIAKKYNLDIVQKPDRNSSIPVYVFSVKGEVDKSLSGIRKETGVKYADPNYRMYSGFGGPDPIYQYEDNRMKAALAGEEIPARPAPSRPADGFFQTSNPPIPTSGSAMPQVNPQLEQAMFAAAEQQRNLPNQMLANGQNATAYQANLDGSLTPIQAPKPIQGDQARPVGVQPRFQTPQMQSNPAINQMANYNQMLQQGMRRNQDMNQAAQNLAAPAGPVRSFSQMAGGTRRARRTPRQPRNNFLSPSNQKLI